VATLENLGVLLACGQDSALLRFSLGSEYFKLGDWPHSREHLRRAVELDPGYSAAWKLLGKALMELGEPAAARAVFDSGIETARGRGDIQAAKEMEVFRRRLIRQIEATAGADTRSATD
jgi:uncharacterized protein HemY